MSPNYPAYYPPNTWTSTLLRAPEGIRVRLNVTSVRLADSAEDECYDSLTVYDGADSATSERLLRLCSTEASFTVLESSTNALLVVFSSDYAVQAAGFQATYSFLTGEGAFA